MNNIINRNIRSLALLVFGLIGLTTLAPATKAQDVAGRIAFGIDAGLNKYYGNYSDNQFALHGDAFIRWNIFDWLSLHAAYNGGQLKYKTTQKSMDNEIALFPNGSAYSNGIAIDEVNHTRVGGWDLMASYNVFPDQTFVPYVIGGIEALNFEPNDANDKNLRGNGTGAYSKNVIGGVGGVGFEMFISPKITFNGKFLLHLTGTDWLDDYSNPADYRQDAFLTMGVGFGYYIFAPETPDAPNTTTYDRTIIHDITEHTVYHSDTIYIKDPTDTIYLESPKINTIFNFPGTLFIVNTDQFNTAEPNNMGNLYHIRHLVDQCPNLKVEIMGYASAEGTKEHNQELSERRANRIKSWLMEQGVRSDKIANTIGYGDTRPAVRERSDVSASELEAERTQNRRIAVKVVQACN